jgi:hypothetical protein
MAGGFNHNYQQNIPQSGLVLRRSDLLSFQKSMAFQSNDQTYYIDARTMRLDAAVARCPAGSTFILGPGSHCVGATIHITQRCRIIGHPSALLAAALTYLDHDDIELEGVVFNSKVGSSHSGLRFTSCSWAASTAVPDILLQLAGSGHVISRCWSEQTVPALIGINLTTATNSVVYGTDFSAHTTPIAHLTTAGHRLEANLGMPDVMARIPGTANNVVTVDGTGTSQNVKDSGVSFLSIPVMAYATSAVSIVMTTANDILSMTSAGTTATLPTAIGAAARRYTIDNASAGDIFVTGTLGQTINGVATQTIPADSCMTVYSNGANWRIC